MKKCPYCAEEIQDEAVVCHFCGRYLLIPPPEITKLPQQQSSKVVSPSASANKKRAAGCLISTIMVIVILAIAWVAVRPGVFTVQPIGVLPDGETIIYYARDPNMPIFSSPDSLCLKMQGSVSLLCRGTALISSSAFTDRIILRLPYSRWAYLQSTGGLEFNK